MAILLHETSAGREAGRTTTTTMIRRCCITIGWTSLAIMMLSVTVTSGQRHGGTPPQRFKAAVYAHRPIWPDPSDNSTINATTARALIRQNLDIYEQQARKAARQGAVIIVFPEYGLHPPEFPDRASALNFMEDIPDPSAPEFELNPCVTYRDNHTSVLVQYRLSCMARKHEIHIVANTGRYSPCAPNATDCEPARYLYSSNVVYDSEGKFVARSDKIAMSKEFEPFFDRPPTTPIQVFEIGDLGCFGTFTTGDIRAYKPGMDTIDTARESWTKGMTILYPTAWTNEKPFMESVAFYSSVAMATGVNILAAGLHLPEQGIRGSGIYSGAYGEIEYYNNRDADATGKLLISELRVNPPQKENKTIPLPEYVDDCGKDMKIEIHGDRYTLRKLCQLEGELTLRKKDTTCHLAYKQPTVPKQNEGYYGLAVFVGLHDETTDSVDGYLEVCALVSCSPEGACGQVDTAAILDGATLTGKFSSDVLVMPSVFFRQDEELDSSMWDFATDSNTNTAQIVMDDLEEDLTALSLYGRYYSKDVVSAQTRVQISVISLSLLVLFAVFT